MARLSPRRPPLLALTVDMFADPARTGVAALPRLEALLRTVHHEVDPASILNTAGAALYADRLAELREPLWRVVLRGREGGLGRRHLVALMDLCVDDFHRGEWGEAAELAAEGLRVSEERGGRFFGWYFRYHQALLAAVQGRFDTSRALAGQIIGWAGPRGVRTAQVFAHQPLVLADLGQGDFESAYQHATAMSPAGTLASHVPHCLWVAMDLVEAAARGLTRTPSSVPGVAALTPQEMQIARLAASGMTNKQIAERLFLSPGTVGGHLYQILPRAGYHDASRTPRRPRGGRQLLSAGVLSAAAFRSATRRSSVLCAAPGSVSRSAMAAAPLRRKARQDPRPAEVA